MFFLLKRCVAGTGIAPVGRFKHKTRPRCLPKTIILNCAPKVGHNIKYYER